MNPSWLIALQVAGIMLLIFGGGGITLALWAGPGRPGTEWVGPVCEIFFGIGLLITIATNSREKS